MTLNPLGVALAEGPRQSRVESGEICSALGQEKEAKALPWLPLRQTTPQGLADPLWLTVSMAPLEG